MGSSDKPKKMPECVELVGGKDKKRVWNQPTGISVEEDEPIDPRSMMERGIHVVEFVGVSKGKKPMGRRYRWNVKKHPGGKPLNALIDRALRMGLKFLRITDWQKPPTQAEIKAVEDFNRRENAGKQIELFGQEGK